ncbi:phosphatidylserine/phosphatidylglycerophosphate/cardiolipin synthase family protein [uncultured Ilumatobacter sp.]|uniref:phospholipase D-like domain-containing protein n=1 Tax=uncultured Ilumatobacter sp. TaxID=879968 RepID=UPI00374FA3C3
MGRASSSTGSAPPGAREWADRVHSLLGIHATEGNTVDVLRNGDEIFGAMLDAIDGAEQTVDIVTFVFWSGHIADRFAQALVGAANRGCRVRVLIDALAERKLDSDVINAIKGSSCELRWFRPFTDEKIPQLSGANNRTHRKILVVDGTVGFIGGVGIADEWSGNARNKHEYRDTHLRVRGPAVAGLQAGFIDNWADHNHSGFDPMSESVIDSQPEGTTACAVVQAAAENGSNDIWRLMITLIACAQKRIRIASAYFNPGEQLTQALIDAVDSGVSVDIMLPGAHADKRFIQITGEASYQRLLQAGVVLHTYEVSMMHAKVMTVDGTVASVGSANFNQRSLRHDDEANIVVFDPDVVAVLDRHLDEDLEHCVLLDPQEWAARGLFQRVAERVTETVNHWL